MKNDEPTEGLLPIKEVARRLGISPYTLYYWAKAGKIPHYRIGRKLRFSWPDVVKWLEEHKNDVA